MTVILFANIGSRDLNLQRENFFEQTQDLWGKIQNNTSTWENLDCPILFPIITTIQANFRIDQIYLFSTLQGEGQSQDTFFAAKLIKKLTEKNFDISYVQVNVIPDNPANLDLMFEYYHGFFEKINISNIKIAYLSITAGTPACNMALLINGLQKFLNHTQVIYKSQMELKAKELGVGEILFKEILMEQFKTLKQAEFYGLAADLADTHDLISPAELLKLRAKFHQLQFDFKSALEKLRPLQHTLTGKELAVIKEKIEKLEILTLSDDEYRELAIKLNSKYFDIKLTLLGALLDNIFIKWKQQAYVDFLGRIFRFEEALLRLVFEKETGITTEKVQGEFKAFVDYFKTNAELSAYLENQKPPITYTEPNRMVLFHVLKFLVTKKRKGRLGIFYKFSTDINTPPGDSLADLRNKSIIAHGYKGISREEIFSKLPRSEKNVYIEKEFFDQIKKVYQSLRKFIQEGS